jgi:hypothetical protein
LTARKSTAVTPALNKPTRENNSFKSSFSYLLVYLFFSNKPLLTIIPQRPKTNEHISSPLETERTKLPLDPITICICQILFIIKTKQTHIEQLFLLT